MRGTDSPMCVKSGDVLTFQTTDPECRPLPDSALMDMQWKLSQVVSLSAADADMNFLDSEHGDDDCAPMPPAHRREVEEWLSSVDSSDGFSDDYSDDSDD